ncbi:hypothetical protein [Candidatus Galacturonibacter soehngenii]|uniref:Uncharacterized protein n=1 Tax=Candidatus Galacturonatibacter soehngenii TaxID=2307010 RepID=A0A7V7UAZ1_9FIRM|nr:hypothetical protein [Candidatus Galacturonibacter soehngenii]KAB1437553.1 hypothetical protein F7O84_08065 [Candidatus Galacturonibacter soehngenii]
MPTINLGRVRGNDGDTNVDTVVEYTEPSSYEEPASGDTIRTLFSKIAKGLSELFNTKIDKANISHNLLTTNPDMVLGADMGKVLNDSLTNIKNPLAGVNIAGNYVYSVGTDDKTKLRITLNGRVSHPRIFVFGDRNGFPILMVLTGSEVLNLGYGSATYSNSNGVAVLTLAPWSYVTIVSNHVCTIIRE